jgi:hypothetical protein
MDVAVNLALARSQFTHSVGPKTLQAKAAM